MNEELTHRIRERVESIQQHIDAEEETMNTDALVWEQLNLTALAYALDVIDELQPKAEVYDRLRREISNYQYQTHYGYAAFGQRARQQIEKAEAERDGNDN